MLLLAELLLPDVTTGMVYTEELAYLSSGKKICIPVTKAPLARLFKNPKKENTKPGLL